MSSQPRLPKIRNNKIQGILLRLSVFHFFFEGSELEDTQQRKKLTSLQRNASLM